MNYGGYTDDELKEQLRILNQDVRELSSQASRERSTGVRQEIYGQVEARKRVANEVRDELNRRRDARAAARKPQPDARAQRAAAQQAREDERDARMAERAARAVQAANAGDEVARAQQAARQYLATLGQTGSVRVWSVELRWRDADDYHYLGYFNPSNSTLRVHIRVGEGTPEARRMGGGWYRPADTAELVRQAKVADTKRY